MQLIRPISYILIVLGLYLLACAGVEELRGKTPRPFRYVPFSQRSMLENDEVDPTYLFSGVVSKKVNAKLFRGFMDAHWLYASVIEVAGILLWLAKDSWPRAYAFMVIVLGIYLLGSAGYQEIRGRTVRPLHYMPFTKKDILDNASNNMYQFSIIVYKKNNPSLFRDLMKVHWLWAGLIEAAGIAICATLYRIPESKTVPVLAARL